MSKLGPVSRRKLIARLHQMGFEGPFSGGNHMFMSKGDLDLAIPNPHESDISTDLMVRILKQAAISRKEWLGQ